MSLWCKSARFCVKIWFWTQESATSYLFNQQCIHRNSNQLDFKQCSFFTEESPSKHGSQPSSSSTSPRATTPKRGPPPLVYTSHSSLSSPPVVTIAPTQSHASMVSSDSRVSELIYHHHDKYYQITS